MQLRELLNNQQVLTPLVSAKSTSLQPETDVFSQLLAQKNEDGSKKIDLRESIRYKEKTPKHGNELHSTKFNVKVSANEPAKVETQIGKTAETEKKADFQPVEKKEVETKETKSKVEADKDVDSPNTANKNEKLKSALKEKLKKETGLSDQQIESLLASLNLDTNALAKLLAGGEAAKEIFSELTEVLETLEIDQALETKMSPKDIDHVTKQIDKLVEALSKLETSEENQNVDAAGKENGKNFEMRTIQALSRLVETLNSIENGTEIKPENVRKAIVEAIASQTVAPVVIENAEQTDSSVAANIVDVELPAMTTSQASSNSSASSDSDSTQNQNNNSNTAQTVIQTTTTTNATTSNQMNAQTSVNRPTDNIATANVETEVKASAADEVKGAINQMAMKQSNFVTTPTVQASSQTRQEIFTQIVDAIKGHIKLSDHGTSMVVKLNPDQLGNVEIKLNITKGIVLAEIKVENEIVKAAIESNLDDLKQSLNSKGYSIDQLSVNVDSGKKERRETFEFQDQNRKSKQTKDTEESIAIEASESLNKYVLNDYEGSTINYYG